MGWFSGKRSIRVQLLLAAMFIEVVMLSVLVWNGQRLTSHYLLVETQLHVSEVIPLVNAAVAGPVMQEDLSTLNELVEDILSGGQIRYIEIQDASGETLLSKGQLQEAEWMKRDNLTQYLRENKNSDRFSFRESITIKGRVVGYFNMQLDVSLINAALQDQFTQSVGIASAEVVLTLIFLLLTGYALTRNLATLSSSVRQVAAGDFSHRVSIGSNDEIGDVARAINHLLSEVEKSHGRIVSQNEEISRLTRFSPVGIFQTDARGLCVYVNQRWVELTGLPAEQAMGNGWSKAIHPEDVQNVLSSWEQAVATLGVYQGEFRFCCNHQEKWVSVRAEPLMEQGRLVSYYGSMTDITARKRTDNIMQVLAKGVHQQSYDAFLRATVKHLAGLYGVKYAFIGALQEDGQHIDIKAIWDGEKYLDDVTYHLDGTPCRQVIDNRKSLIELSVWRNFPEDQFLAEQGVESYFGTVILSSSDKVMGLISLMDTRPMSRDIWNDPALDVFATRVAVEMERYSTLQQLEEHQRHLEDLVRVRTSRMEQLNAELESFCYSVSHDLRAPLRSINGFTRALLEDYSAVIDEQGVDYLSRVYRGANRMSDLIDALLELSRVTRTEPVSETIDLSVLAQEILDDLQVQQPERHVSIRVQPGLAVVADRRFMKIILANLLENAWKYTSRKDDAKIEVGVVRIDAEDVFFIRDNGVGFDMRYASKLFEAFQRLHLVDEFEGTGIGLATVHKVIQQYGGRIWADATPGKGATFYFKLASENMAPMRLMREC